MSLIHATEGLHVYMVTSDDGADSQLHSSKATFNLESKNKKMFLLSLFCF